MVRMATPGIEPRTFGLVTRYSTYCATEAACQLVSNYYTYPNIAILSTGIPMMIGAPYGILLYVFFYKCKKQFFTRVMR